MAWAALSWSPNLNLGQSVLGLRFRKIERKPTIVSVTWTGKITLSFEIFPCSVPSVATRHYKITTTLHNPCLLDVETSVYEYIVYFFSTRKGK